jgi:hypothetical protein
MLYGILFAISAIVKPALALWIILAVKSPHFSKQIGGVAALESAALSLGIFRHKLAIAAVVLIAHCMGFPFSWRNGAIAAFKAMFNYGEN